MAPGHVGPPRSVAFVARRARALLPALAVYLTTILPTVRRELSGWRRRAERIPDPVLRRHALAALREKGANSEAVAVFAILAPRRRRRTVVKAIAALQVAIDYIDLLGEHPAPDPLADGLQLHRALPAAVSQGAAAEDWYRFHPRREDGGYLSSLASACRRNLGSLPAATLLEDSIAAAAWRCGQGQSHTHAAVHDDGVLERWARRLDGPAGYSWWEVAAGASSSVAAHALIAAAARSDSTPRSAATVDAAYFPSIGALTVLLDDLVDRERDAIGGEHNYTAYYPSAEVAGDRLATIARQAGEAIASLPDSRRHSAILTGVLAFYLSAPSAGAPDAAPARERLMQEAGATVRTLAAIMGLRHGRKRPRSAGSAPGP